MGNSFGNRAFSQNLRKDRLRDLLKRYGLMRHLFLLAVFFMMVMLAASCRDIGDVKEDRCKRAEKALGNIIIGVAAPFKWLDGKSSYKQGIEMAAEEINDDGGVMQRKITLVFRDDHGDVDQGRIIAQEFAENLDMTAVIGHFNSHVSIPASIMYQYYGLLMLSPASTADELTDQLGYDMIFRNIPTSKVMAEGLARFCASRGYKKMIVYGLDNKGGTALANAFEYRAAELGIDIVDYRTFDFTSDAFYFSQDIERWDRYFQIDAIFLSSNVEQGLAFIRAARKLGMNQPIITGDGLDSPLILKNTGEDKGTVIVGSYYHQDMPGKTSLGFVYRFQRKYGILPDVWAAQGYDAVKILAAAMNKAGTTVPSKVSESLRSIENWEGVTGTYQFNEHGDVINKRIVIKQAKTGHYEYIGME